MMKRKIDLEKAAEAEVFGCLAARSGVPKRAKKPNGSNPFTEFQVREIAGNAHALFHFATEAGAMQNRIKVGDVSLTLEKRGSSRILSVEVSADE